MVKTQKKNRSRGVVGSVLVILAVITILSLYSYGQEKNFLGPVGQYLSNGLVRTLGLSSYFAAFAYGAMAVAVFKRRWFRGILRTVLALALFMAFLNAMFTLLNIPDMVFGSGRAGGGELGLFLTPLMIKYTGEIGTYIISISCLFISISVVARRPAYAGHLGLGKVLWFLLRGIGVLLWMAFRGSKRRRLSKEARAERERVIQSRELELENHFEEMDDDGPPLIIKDRTILDGEDIDFDFEEEPVLEEPRKRVEGYGAPPLSILDLPEKVDREERDDSIMERTRFLEEKLEDFGVSGKVRQVLPGPVITTYEFEPASGVKVNKIVNLSDDLALGMRAISIRIVAPVPGKSVVGIEIPNKNRESVYLKEIMMSSQFQNSNAKLTLGLGRDIMGDPVITDLAQIPHLLIAWATGYGKSVALNSMICSIL